MRSTSAAQEVLDAADGSFQDVVIDWHLRADLDFIDSLLEDGSLQELVSLVVE